MKQFERVSSAPKERVSSALRVWAMRALAIVPLFSAGAGCQVPVPNSPSTSNPFSGDIICWEGVEPNQYPPSLYALSPDESFFLKNSFELYFQKSNVQIPEFFYKKERNDGGGAFSIDSEDLNKLYENRCMKGSYEPRNIKTPDTLETVTVKYEGGQFAVPIVRLACETFTTNHKGKKVPVGGLYFTEGRMIITRDTASQSTFDHEATHAFLDAKWKEGGINGYDQRKIRADRVLTKTELEMMGLEPCNPLSMDLVNEMIARTVEKIKAEKTGNFLDQWSYEADKAYFALGMNTMSRIASVMKNGNQAITNKNYEEFDPYLLFSRKTEWSSEPWAEEVMTFAAKKSPLAPLISSVAGSADFARVDCGEEQSIRPDACKQIEAFVVEEVLSKKEADSEYITKVISYLFFRADRLSLESALDALYKINPDSVKEMLKKTSFIMEVTMFRTDPSFDWQIDLLEKYGIDTKRMREAAKKRDADNK